MEYCFVNRIPLTDGMMEVDIEGLAERIPKKFKPIGHPSITYTDGYMIIAQGCIPANEETKGEANALKASLTDNNSVPE